MDFSNVGHAGKIQAPAWFQAKSPRIGRIYLSTRELSAPTHLAARNSEMAEVQTPRPVKQTLSIVFVGSFNPRIFHPTWFEREGLTFPEEEAASLSETRTNGPLVTPDLSRCEIGQEITIECLTNRFSINAATTLGEERLRSIAAAILAKLPHTPITAVGINHSQVFDTRNEGEWHQIGDLLVPKQEIWSKVMEGRPGMALLRVEELRPGPPRVRVWATVEPVREPHPPYRFAINTNWHTDIPQNPTDLETPAELASDFVASQWDVALDFGRKIAKTLFENLRGIQP
jgi:hypothetical protein